MLTPVDHGRTWFPLGRNLPATCRYGIGRNPDAKSLGMNRGASRGVSESCRARSALGIAVVGILLGTPTASAEITTSAKISTDTASEDGSHITDVEYIDDRNVRKTN